MSVVSGSPPDVLDGAEYPRDGLTISRENLFDGTHRLVLHRAEPRASVTAEWLYDCVVWEAVQVVGPQMLRVECDRGAMAGRALYRVVAELFADRRYLLAWPD